MPVLAENAVITPEEMLAIDDGKRYELIDGQLVEKNMGLRSYKVATRLGGWLDDYTEKNNGGHSVVDGTYMCFPKDPGLVRSPDVSFIRAGRLPGEIVPTGHCLIAPDLAVEVVSPNDKIDELDEKIEEYFEAGVLEVWVIRLIRKSVNILQRNGSERVVRFGDTLSSPELLPGFTRPLSDLFRNIQA